MEQKQYTLNDLYRHLFETLADLRAKKIDVQEANAAANIAQTIINGGKLECKFIDTIGGKGTGFMPDEHELPSRDRLKLVNRWGRTE